ncbi:MAG: sensor histidine kinase [Flavobacterium sp.]
MKFDDHQLQQDVLKIRRISIVPAMLNAICKATNMGFAAIARVTDDRWIACSVADKINFGLGPGDELEIESTICHEIRESRKLVAFDNADEDPAYKDHHTPRIYGIKSYISVPIFTKSGDFFGTLCAIDPSPKQVNNETTIDLFKMFTDLISFHLDAIDQLQESTDALRSEKELIDERDRQIEKQGKKIAMGKEQLQRSDSRLTKSIEVLAERDASIVKLNEELSALAYISSHDLQEPLRKIQMFSNILAEKEKDTLSEKSFDYLKRITLSAARLQSLITDLLTYTINADGKNTTVDTDVEEIIREALNDLKDELIINDADVTVTGSCKIPVIPFQIRQLIYNLVSNSLQFAGEGRQLKIDIDCTTKTGAETGIASLDREKRYCHIIVADNGIGFEQQYSARIFDLFERLVDDHKIKGTGIGLAIVKKVVNNHKGHITAYGEENKGATFNVYLPG